MAWAAVQTANNSAGSGTSVSVTTSATAQNNLVVVHVEVWWSGGGGTAPSITVTDNQSNTYVVTSNSPKRLSDSDYNFIFQAYGVQTTSGTTSVTITGGGTYDNYLAVVNEFSGGELTNAEVFDVSQADRVGSGYGSTSYALTTFSPAASGELIAATYGMDGMGGITYTAGTNYTLYGGKNLAGFYYLQSEYRLSGTTSETAPISTSAASTSWAGIGSAFKQLSTDVKVRSVGTAVAWGNGTTAVLTKPSALAVGDLMISCIFVNGTDAITGTPSGWSLIRDNANGGGIRGIYHQKIADSSDVAASNFTWTFASTVRRSGCILRITGHDPTTPVVTSAVDTSVTNTANASFSNAVTPGVANCLLILGATAIQSFSSIAGYAVTNNNPATWTERFEQVSDSSDDETAAVATATYTATTTTGNSSITSSTGTADWVGTLIAIQPTVSASRPKHLALLGVG